MSAAPGLEEYRSLGRRSLLLLLLLLCGIGTTAVANIAIGSSGISLKDIFLVLLGGPGEGNSRMIILDIRLPMALTAASVGAALGLGGCEIQTILRNPIASPYTLGISSAASFGAAVGLILNVRSPFFPGQITVTASSFFFTLLSAAVLYSFSTQRYIGRNAIILFGVALNFLFNSLTMLLQYIADENELQSLVFWTFGSLLKATWPKLTVIAVVLAASFVILYRRAWRLTAMTLEDAKARSLGVPVERLRRLVLVLVSLLTAAAVCFVGTIGFIGLIAPHIARLAVGEDQRYFMPCASLLGAFILSLAFLVSKLVIPGVILPVGLVTAFIGIPFFLTMIVGKRRSL